MKTFSAVFLGFLAAAIVLLGAVVIVARSEAWQRRTAELAKLLGRDDDKLRTARADRDSARPGGDVPRADREVRELQEQRRERLTLLTATLGVRPIARLTDTEKQLFQEAERNRAQRFGESEQRPMIHMIEPVQIDEWTVLRAGTPVEFVGYNRDNVITIRHQGARYEVSPWQAGLPIAHNLPAW